MKVELLGTGAIGAKSYSASALINEHILLDIPNGTMKNLHRTEKKVSDIDTCVITHFHGDHYFDIPFLLLELLWDKERTKPFQIIGGEGLKEKIILLTKLAFPHTWEKIEARNLIQVIEVKDGDRVLLDSGITLQVIAVEHGNMKSAFGYVFEEKGKKVAFTGDTNRCDAVMDLVESAEVIVADTSELEGNSSHMGLKDILEIANRYQQKRFITTHMQEETKHIAKERRVSNVIVPEDGFLLEI